MRITIIGGGSVQWVPILADDIAIAPCLAGSEIVLHDIDPGRLPRVAAYVEHVGALAGSGLEVRATTDLAEALDGSDFVVVCISTGGLESMARDLDVSARFGVPMPVGDTVGPAGISRALRNVPVLTAIAREMERRCPDAWMCNVTNPLTALTRAVTRETSIKAVGLCHEVGNFRFFVSQMLDCGYFDVVLRVTGVNHFPLVVGVEVDGRDRFEELVDVAHGRGDLGAPLPFLDQVFSQPPIASTGGGPSAATTAPGWTKQRLRDFQSVNYEVLRCFGALPAADKSHTVEFLPGFVTAASGWGSRWAVESTTIAERAGHEATYVAGLDVRMRTQAPPRGRSTEMVVDVIEALCTGAPAELSLNIPNRGQCPDLPDGVVVEAMCVVDGDGIRGRDRAVAPPVLAGLLSRVVASQELTVEAALGGDRDLVLAALFADPLAGALDHDVLLGLRDAILEATSDWLPQF